MKKTLTCAGLLLLAGCGGGGGGTSTLVAPTGTLTLAVSDAPIDAAEQVVVQFHGVEIHPAEGETEVVTFDSSRQIDLLSLTRGEFDLLLEDLELAAGTYNWLRLQVDAEEGVRDSYIVINGEEHELRIPSGAQTGLKLNRTFEIVEGENQWFTIDFNLRQSVHSPSGNDPEYVLRPTLRVVSNADAGTLSGNIDANLITESCAPAVYVYEGSVVADDVDGLDPDPLTSAQVELDGVYAYVVPFLPSGDYTVAFTCNADVDEPETDDEGVEFSAQAQTSIVAGETTTLDL